MPISSISGLAGDAELLLGLDLGGQAVAVPAEAALDPAAAHRLVARHDVLDVAGEQVAVVRQAVGERRAVVEDELVGAVSPGSRWSTEASNVSSLRPELEHLVLERGEVRPGVDVGIGHDGDATEARSARRREFGAQERSSSNENRNSSPDSSRPTAAPDSSSSSMRNTGIASVGSPVPVQGSLFRSAAASTADLRTSCRPIASPSSSAAISVTISSSAGSVSPSTDATPTSSSMSAS